MTRGRRRQRGQSMQRDLSTILFRIGRLSLVLEPRDLWLGVYVAPRAVYVCVIPCLPLRWERRRG